MCKATTEESSNRSRWFRSFPPPNPRGKLKKRNERGCLKTKAKEECCVNELQTINDNRSIGKYRYSGINQVGEGKLIAVRLATWSPSGVGNDNIGISDKCGQ
ncbi:hypothetical protein J6590_054475 [Homalodisca vitripennis]|nr:hypothetical protein J6590_054475 [Homalodisca vitripennis]